MRRLQALDGSATIIKTSAVRLGASIALPRA